MNTKELKAEVTIHREALWQILINDRDTMSEENRSRLSEAITNLNLIIRS